MFQKDSRTETFLTQMGVEFVYTNRTTYAELSPDWNKVNLGRPNPLRDDAIVEYASLMESGSPAPAPILHQTSKGYDVLDGVQRLSAGQLISCTNFPAYKVKCDSENVLASIRVLANARLQGRPEPPEWTRRRAVEVLVVDRGMSTAEVARLGGWKVGDIDRIAQAVTWNKHIQGIGGPDLPDAMLETVSQHTTVQTLHNAPVEISEFLNLVKRAKFSSADAEPLITRFFQPVTKPRRAQAIYAERLHEIESDAEVQIRLKGRKGPAQPRHIVLHRCLKSTLTVLEEISAAGDDLPYADEFFRLLKDINEQLRNLTTHNPKPMSARTPADMWSRDE